ncbi:MAG: DUF3619 family protein [Enterobacterales bacterium]|nr:DUF3619 family protein [Enterobacterales bacterium]
MTDKQPLETRINQNLDASIENLDPTIRRRLNQARMKALEEQHKPKINWRITSAVSFAMILALSWNFIPQTSVDAEPLLAEVLQEDLEMLDDLEFIVWMSEGQDDVSN